MVWMSILLPQTKKWPRGHFSKNSKIEKLRYSTLIGQKKKQLAYGCGQALFGWQRLPETMAGCGFKRMSGAVVCARMSRRGCRGDGGIFEDGESVQQQAFRQPLDRVGWHQGKTLAENVATH